MTILDLTEDYITLRSQGRVGEEYEKFHPAMFTHYFTYWCAKEREEPALTDEAIRERTQRVVQGVKKTERVFGKRGLDVRDFTVVLFVGKNTSNGHAFLDSDRWVVWLPVETYTSDSLAKVFIVHELAHALHYRMSPKFYFSDNASKHLLGRQLITEGLATYVTAEILGVSDIEALWADYLSPKRAETWMAECGRRDSELRSFCRRHFSESMPDCGLFLADNPGDILNFRAGYYLGLSLIRAIAAHKKLDITDLLQMKRHQLEKLTIAELAGTQE